MVSPLGMVGRAPSGAVSEDCRTLHSLRLNLPEQSPFFARYYKNSEEE